MKTNRKRWLVDLGNSRLKCALLDAQGRRGEILAIGHEHASALAIVLQHLGAAAPMDEVWLASVASVERTQALIEALHAAGFSVRPIRTQPQWRSLRIAYAEPSRLGVDRFLSLVAASGRNDGPWLIVSAGSALTVDLLDAGGEHIGGLIAPMPGQMRAVLAQNFAQLDLPVGHCHDFAADTADAIASGARSAALGLVERSLRRAHQRLDAPPTLLIGGGGADLFADIEHPRVVQAPSLVLDGMAAYVQEGAQ